MIKTAATFSYSKQIFVLHCTYAEGTDINIIGGGRDLLGRLMGLFSSGGGGGLADGPSPFSSPLYLFLSPSFFVPASNFVCVFSTADFQLNVPAKNLACKQLSRGSGKVGKKAKKHLLLSALSIEFICGK